MLIKNPLKWNHNNESTKNKQKRKIIVLKGSVPTGGFGHSDIVVTGQLVINWLLFDGWLLLHSNIYHLNKSLAPGTSPQHLRFVLCKQRVRFD